MKHKNKLQNSKIESNHTTDYLPRNNIDNNTIIHIITVLNNKNGKTNKKYSIQSYHSDNDAMK